MFFLSLNWHTLDLQVHFLAMAVLLIFIAMLLMTFPTGSDDGSINTLLQSIKMVIKTLEHVFWAHLQQLHHKCMYHQFSGSHRSCSEGFLKILNCLWNLCKIKACILFSEPGLNCLDFPTGAFFFPNST